MPPKKGSGSSVTFSAKPCVVTQREMWMPIAAILSLPTQSEETRSRTGERSAAIPKSARVRMQDLLEIGHVSFDVAAVRIEVQDRIADELARPVVRDLAAAVAFDDRDAERRAARRA